jgi:hypothetical protein
VGSPTLRHFVYNMVAVTIKDVVFWDAEFHRPLSFSPYSLISNALLLTATYAVLQTFRSVARLIAE